MHLIALDLGTSFIKGAVLDLDTHSIGHILRAPFPEPLPGQPALFCEVDPLRVVAAARDLIERLLPHAPGCAGVVCCTQMQCVVLTADDGRPLSNCISWRDQRALQPHPSGQGTYYDVLREHITDQERRAMGNELKPGLPVCALYWLAEQGQLPGPEAIPASLADFVIANLCHTAPCIEPTNASVHGVYDFPAGDWHRPVIRKLGLDGLRWPRIARSGEIAGYLDMAGQQLPCYVPVGDQPCALAGALLAPGELSINIATGSQVSLLSDRFQPGDYQTRPFFDGRYLNLITHIPAGRSLNLLLALLGELGQAQGSESGDPWPYITRAAAAVDATDLRVDLAFFAGACGDRGSLTNIHEGNLTMGHLFRAAFESMAGNYLACALRLSPARQWQRLVFSGGLAQKVELLRRIICERFGDEHRLSPSPEDTLVGLLALGMACTGQAGSTEEAIGRLAQSSTWGRGDAGGH
jgi:sugar (pentulose or hexulose) kinase